MFVALSTHQHVWKSEETKKIDAVLSQAGFTLCELPWSTFELCKHDQDHFTWNGFRAFARALVSAVASLGLTRVEILADSTIDHCNFEGHVRTGRADAHLTRAFACAGIDARVDAWCGSGFVAMADVGADFPSRLSPSGCALLVVGGWNDTRHGAQAVARAARRMVRCARRPP